MKMKFLKNEELLRTRKYNDSANAIIALSVIGVVAVIASCLVVTVKYLL